MSLNQKHYKWEDYKAQFQINQIPKCIWKKTNHIKKLIKK